MTPPASGILPVSSCLPIPPSLAPEAKSLIGPLQARAIHQSVGGDALAVERVVRLGAGTNRKACSIFDAVAAHNPAKVIDVLRSQRRAMCDGPSTMEKQVSSPRGRHQELQLVLSLSPVARAAALMSDGQNSYFLGSDGVDD